MSDRPEADRVTGTPHPRDCPRLIGHAAAEAEILASFDEGRLHHAWLLTGPQGIGKATLAWRLARFLIATPPQDGSSLFGEPVPLTSLDIPDDHPVARRMIAGAEPGLCSITRPFDEKTKRLKAQITVEELRRLSSFFGLSAADGGRRVVIIDSADEMNASAANALLKMLEEPPRDAVLLLISHQPARLLPTIRSRCRTLRLGTLGPADMAAAVTAAGGQVDPASAAALSELAQGSVGAALRLLSYDGLEIYAQLVALLASSPQLDRQRALALANSCAGRQNEARLDLVLQLLDVALARLARAGALGRAPEVQAAAGESTMISRLAPNAQSGRDWAARAQVIGDRARHARGVNVDAATLVLDALLSLQDTVAV
jgi:DNA polymerase-3 subunit delta'